MDKKVSLITPCLNGEKFVGRYLDSVLNQTYKNIELIFINDGSTDRTEEIVKAYEAKFIEQGMDIIYIYQENRGQATALNKGLKIFTGDYLTWPDSDDILHEESIEKKVRFLEENKEYGLVRSDAAIVDENNLGTIKEYLSRNYKDKFNEEIFEDLLFEETYLCCGCYMVRTENFLRVNSKRYIYEGKGGGQNWQMLLPITYKYKCGYIDEPLYTYVIRANSHSHDNRSDLNYLLIRWDEHKDILVNTLNSMEIRNDKRKEYLDKIDERYLTRKFRFSVYYRNIALMKKYYPLVKENNYKISLKDYTKYLINRNILCNYAIKKMSGIKRSLLG